MDSETIVMNEGFSKLVQLLKQETHPLNAQPPLALLKLPKLLSSVTMK